VRRSPTERQAALAARQLHYHRERLRWIRDRMRDNEALLLIYLTRLGADATVLPGGYRVEDHASTGRGVGREVGVEKLVPESLYEQLVLPVARLSGDPAHGRESPESPRKEVPA
jgi:hypothetical protein